jgi:hypothetical protein
VAYDPCAPNIPAAPVGAPVHHHYVHRIVGRVRPRIRAPIHKIAARPLTPDGCARATGGALNTPRPATIGAAGAGAGKVAALAGVGSVAIGGSLIPSDGGSPKPPPVSPIIVPPVPVCTVGCGGTTPPVNVPEPATVAIFAMALAALFLVRSITRRARTA